MLTTPCKERAALATMEQPWSMTEATPAMRVVWLRRIVDVYADGESSRSRRMFKPFACDIANPARYR